MLKSEFTALTKRTFTDAEWEDIVYVYAFHPCIDAVDGKKQIAYLFDTFGFAIIADMKPRAEKAEELENKLSHYRAELDAIKAEYSKLKIK